MPEPVLNLFSLALRLALRERLPDLNELNEAGWYRITNGAQNLSKFTSLNSVALLYEAVDRIKNGERDWPDARRRGVRLDRFIFETMRSIASADRKSLARLRYDVLDDTTKSDLPSAEDHIIIKQLPDQIISLFRDSPAEQNFLKALMWDPDFVLKASNDPTYRNLIRAIKRRLERNSELWR
jgi:hypothetical protein